MRCRHIKAVSILLAAGTVAAACGGGQQPSSSGPDKLDGHGPITFVAGKSDASNITQKLIDQWNAGHPQEPVRFVELPSDADSQRQQMVQNAQTKSDAFTVLELDNVWNQEFAANQWISQLPQNTIDPSKFLPPTMNTVTYRGNLYGVPWTTDGALLYYRKDLLDKAGITQPPKTWADMQQDCQKVKALPEAATMSCYAGQYEKYEGLTVNFAEAVNGAGGVITDKDGKPNVNTPQAKAGLDSLVDGFRSGMIPKDAITYKETQDENAFDGGKLIFARNWSSAYANAEATDGSSQVAGKTAVAPIPGLAGPGVSSLGGHSMAISKFAKNKGTAADFIKFMNDDQSQRANLEQATLAPPATSIYDDPAEQAKFPFLPTLKQSILSAQPRPQVVHYGDATQAIEDNVYAALTGAKTSEQALTDLQARLQELTKP
jgi:multiple sugar transport system substrate-binding protein